MNIPRAIELCKYILVDSNKGALFTQELIDKWNDPKDLAQRCAVTMQNIHKMYGREVLAVLTLLQTKCKHPKKYQDICDGMRYCTNCNMDLEKVSKI